MKNLVKLVGIIVLVMVIGFSMTACGGGKTALSGTWFLIEGRGSNIPAKCELLKDGTGFALDQAITWKTENNRLYIIHPSLAMAFDYKISGEKLNLSNDEGKNFVYVKKLGGESAIVGTWFLIEGSSRNIPLTCELLKDGTGFVLGQAIIWKTENNRLYIPGLAMTFDYKMSGSKLNLSVDNEQFVYVKQLGGKSTIAGTWTDIEDRKWDFNPDGKLTYENRQDDIREYPYIVDGNKLAIHIENRLQTYDISVSADGKTASLTGGEDFSNWRVAGPGWSENELKK
jgi:hypothetical protein